ncbi:MAG: hypothetical protein H0X13_17835 [Ramlibacter sp.]|nr:hypothetical protein [Ramlibacter sp.]
MNIQSTDRPSLVCSNVRGVWSLAAALPISITPATKVHEGDLILCEAVNIGAYNHVEDLNGCPVELRPGIQFVGVAGFRESGRSLCGTPPQSAPSRVHLLNNGGLVGHADMPPVHLRPLTDLQCRGILTSGGKTLNTVTLAAATARHSKDFLLGRRHILVLGTGAETGKTTLCCSVIKHARALGLKTLAMKIAGTGRARDKQAYVNAGCDQALDFVDCGLPSTYTSPSRYQACIGKMLDICASSDADVVVSEAGGDSLAGNVDTFLELLTEEEWKTTDCVVVAGDVHALTGFHHHFGRHIPKPWYYMPTYDTNIVAFRRRKEERLPGAPQELLLHQIPDLLRAA